MSSRVWAAVCLMPAMLAAGGSPASADAAGENLETQARSFTFEHPTGTLTLTPSTLYAAVLARNERERGTAATPPITRDKAVSSSVSHNPPISAGMLSMMIWRSIS